MSFLQMSISFHLVPPQCLFSRLKLSGCGGQAGGVSVCHL